MTVKPSTSSRPTSPSGKATRCTLPLPELSAMTAIWQNSLIESLNDFNASYACHHDGDDPSDEFRYAIGEVARRATAMAIFALAAAQRLHMAAHQN